MPTETEPETDVPWLWGKDPILLNAIKRLNPRFRAPHVFHEWGLCTGPDSSLPWSLTTLGVQWEIVWRSWTFFQEKSFFSTASACQLRLLRFYYQFGVYFSLDRDPSEILLPHGFSASSHGFSGLVPEFHLKLGKLLPQDKETRGELERITHLVGLPLLPLHDLWEGVERVSDKGEVLVFQKGSPLVKWERDRIKAREEAKLLQQKNRMEDLWRWASELHRAKGFIIDADEDLSKSTAKALDLLDLLDNAQRSAWKKPKL